jgi:hypothetical protein
MDGSLKKRWADFVVKRTAGENSETLRRAQGENSRDKGGKDSI